MPVEAPPQEQLTHPTTDEIELSAVLHALADPVRLSMVNWIAADQAADAPACCAFDAKVTKSTCTHHFRVLREAGVIRQEKQGTRRLNSLRREDLESRFPGLLDSVLAAAPKPSPN